MARRLPLAAALLLLSAACSPEYDLRANRLAEGDVLVAVGSFALEDAELHHAGFRVPVSALIEARFRNQLVRLDGQDVIEVDERIERLLLTLRVPHLDEVRRPDPLQGVHTRAFRHQGVWERSLASGKLALHQRYILETVAHPLGWELLPRVPLEVGESASMSNLDIAGFFGMPLYAEVEGTGRLTLTRVDDGVAYMAMLVTTRIQHSGLGWFVYQLRGEYEVELGAGYVRRHSLTGHMEVPLEHLGERGRLIGETRMEGGLTPE